MGTSGMVTVIFGLGVGGDAFLDVVPGGDVYEGITIIFYG